MATASKGTTFVRTLDVGFKFDTSCYKTYPELYMQIGLEGKEPVAISSKHYISVARVKRVPRTVPLKPGERDLSALRKFSERLVVRLFSVEPSLADAEAALHVPLRKSIIFDNDLTTDLARPLKVEIYRNGASILSISAEEVAQRIADVTGKYIKGCSYSLFLRPSVAIDLAAGKDVFTTSLLARENPIQLGPTEEVILSDLDIDIATF